MTRVAMVMLSLGVAVFVALLAWQGFGAVASTFMAAGWGLAAVAAFHLVPLVIDALAIHVLLYDRRRGHATMCSALIARWSGEAVNSLLPAGQLGGPLIVVRQLIQHDIPLRTAASAITVSTTMQALAQMTFALIGLMAFSAYASGGPIERLRVPAIIVTVVLALLIALFYHVQRRGLFGRLLRIVSKAFAKRDWSRLTTHADTIDIAVRALYRKRRKVAASFLLSLAGWLAGTGEVWLALYFLGHPVSWLDALLLESAGQAIRGAAFAIPGSLGAQEGGYLLLAPLVGLPADTALALSLAKRARELALGVPGLIYLHFSERRWQRRRAAPRMPLAD